MLIFAGCSGSACAGLDLSAFF